MRAMRVVDDVVLEIVEGLPDLVRVGYEAVDGEQRPIERAATIADCLPDFYEVAPDAVEVGWVRDNKGKFKLGPVVVPAAAPPRSQFSFLEFMDLFTDAEQLAIAGAAMADAPTKLWYDRAVGAQFIDMSDQRLIAGMRALVDSGLVTAARHDRVLQGQPPED